MSDRSREDAVPVSEPSLSGQRVLIVDDNATNRRILAQSVIRWGMVPTTASSALEALDILARGAAGEAPFPLVLSDVQMPEMDGFTLLEKIRDRTGTEGPRVVLLTSSGQGGVLGRKLGAAGYLTKPIRQSDLRVAVLNALDTRVETASRIPAPTALLSSEESRHLRVLVAEDNAVNQQLASRLLEKHGHTVVLVDNGHDAVATMKAQEFDLVFMDVQMPGMDGFDATARSGGREALYDCRHDRPRHERRPRTLPPTWHGRLHRQAHSISRVEQDPGKARTCRGRRPIGGEVIACCVL